MEASLKLGNGDWAVKEDSLLAYDDFGGKFRPLPFDFTRASSATVVNKQGLIETVQSGIPRIDFSDDANGALLLEPQSTNYLTQSNQFDTTWTSPSIGVLLNDNQSGIYNTVGAWKLIQNTNAGYHYIQQIVNLTGDYTYSIYAKKGEYEGISFFLPHPSGGYNSASTFNLSNGIFISNTHEGTSLNIGNGWYRLSLKTKLSGVHAINAYVNQTIQQSETGNGTSGIYIQNSQLEQSSYATSYIPTQGAISTRLAESCSQTPPSGIIGQTEGTMFYDFNIEDIALQTQDPVLIYLKNSSGITSYLEMYDNGDLVVVHINSGSITLTKNGLNDGRHKAAFAYKDNDFAFYVDGVLAGSNTNFTVASSQTEIGLQYTSVNYTGKQSVNDVKLYNTRLSNSELAALTTI